MHRFSRIAIDVDPPPDPWCKAIGDIDGDLLPDFVVGGHRPRSLTFLERVLRKVGLLDLEWPAYGELVWYKNPTWRRQRIAKGDLYRTDVEVVDVDCDGKNDVVVTTDAGLVWHRNPDWRRFLVGEELLHDVEAADLDGDGDLDLVARNQSLFGYGNGDLLFVFRQENPELWTPLVRHVPVGEGLKVADMNGDGLADVVVNGAWYANTGTLDDLDEWVETPYAMAWGLADVVIDVADISGDGVLDIVIVPAEGEGGRHRISWFEAPQLPEDGWREHIIDDDVESVHHSVAASDLDQDGNVDVVSAEMFQGKDPDEVKVYWSRSNGTSWEKEVVSERGSHNLRVADIDNDGDDDFFGANWTGPFQVVELWENRSRPSVQTRWRRHVIDENRPWKAIFVMAGDIDEDGYTDIVSGGWWYKNPGTIGGTWLRRAIGHPANNAAVLFDCDEDGDLDILASTWDEPRGLTITQRVLKKLGLKEAFYDRGRGDLVFARNQGRGEFEILRTIDQGSGDFLQGVVQFRSDGRKMVALSWHRPGNGIQTLRIPSAPGLSPWHRSVISEVSQDEALSAGDIDGDGDDDLLMGTRWLRSDAGGQWTLYSLVDEAGRPDRNKLADLNRDGRLDAVVGYEAISRPGRLVWLEQPRDSTRHWTQHLIATIIGPMSLDVADIDSDEDLDVIVGEHDLESPDTARLLLYENKDGLGGQWEGSVISVGDEHHDGAQVVDLDGDGDKDIISIGWGHARVLVYENLLR